jgi:hypothetical protein
VAGTARREEGMLGLMENQVHLKVDHHRSIMQLVDLLNYLQKDFVFSFS